MGKLYGIVINTPEENLFLENISEKAQSDTQRVCNVDERYGRVQEKRIIANPNTCRK
jgi:hypothetical protein